MLPVFAFPCFRAWLAGRRDRPESPDALAGLGLVSGQESAGALVAAGVSGYNDPAGDQRSGRGSIVLTVVCHFDVPEEPAVGAVEREQMGMIGNQEQAVPEDGHSAIDTA